MTNREVLLKTDPCDLLCLIDSRLSKSYICITDLLEGVDRSDVNAMRKCPGYPTGEKCRECISNWLNSESKNNHFV